MFCETEGAEVVTVSGEVADEDVEDEGGIGMSVDSAAKWIFLRAERKDKGVCKIGGNGCVDKTDC